MEPVKSEWVERVKDSGRPIVASVSGGKDSTAMAIWLKQQGVEETNPIYWGYADTGWEHESVYRYIDETLIPYLGKNFRRVKSKKYPGGMVDLCTQKGAFPARRSRFCTDELKKKPLRDLIKWVKFEHDIQPINAVGIRAAESKARSNMLEWEMGSVLAANLCDTWRPLIGATIEHVTALHREAGIMPCDLYLRDEHYATRIGCWPCIMSCKSELKAIAITDEPRVAKIRELEEVVAVKAAERLAKKGETFESRGVGKPTFFQAKDGTGQCWPIDRVMEWSKTAWGGKVPADQQLELFAGEPSERGCQMWGLCDLGPLGDES